MRLNKRYIKIRIVNLPAGPVDLSELQLISTLEKSVPLKKMGMLEGELYGIIPHWQTISSCHKKFSCHFSGFCS